LIERGRDVAYVEHWERDSSSTEPCAAALLCEVDATTTAILVRVGPHFMFARERPIALAAEGNLCSSVAAAPSVAAARALIDCEISCGEAENEFTITASTLPYRRGALFRPRRRGDTLTLSDQDSGGTGYPRRWHIVECEGDWGPAFAAT
jgi:hypothetical protein